MAKRGEEGSIESRMNERHGDNPEYTSPGREVLNSALSLVAVVGLTMVGGAVLKRVMERKMAAES